MMYNIHDPYSTHIPYLISLLDKIKSFNLPILELGCGYGSTPILHKYCIENKIKLITLDNNVEWLNKIKNYFPENEYHKYISVLNWKEELNNLKNNKYSLVFIDQSPWEARTLSLNIFKSISEYILIHDCDYFPTNKIFGKELAPIVSEQFLGERDYSDVFKYYKEYFPKKFACPTGPPTLIGSEYNPIDLIVS
jgi:hypothetical protein